MRTRLSSDGIEYEVRHPDRPAEVLWCHPCVLSVECAHCLSKIGIPCMGATDYRQSTHYVRRYLFQIAAKHGFRVPEDVVAAFEDRYHYKISRTFVAPPEPPKRSEFQPLRCGLPIVDGDAS